MLGAVVVAAVLAVLMVLVALLGKMAIPREVELDNTGLLMVFGRLGLTACRLDAVLEQIGVVVIVIVLVIGGFGLIEEIILMAFK